MQARGESSQRAKAPELAKQAHGADLILQIPKAAATCGRNPSSAFDKDNVVAIRTSGFASSGCS
jgi:hypothetical protein